MSLIRNDAKSVSLLKQWFSDPPVSLLTSSDKKQYRQIWRFEIWRKNDLKPLSGIALVLWIFHQCIPLPSIAKPSIDMLTEFKLHWSTQTKINGRTVFCQKKNSTVTRHPVFCQKRLTSKLHSISTSCFLSENIDVKMASISTCCFLSEENRRRSMLTRNVPFFVRRI